MTTVPLYGPVLPITLPSGRPLTARRAKRVQGEEPRAAQPSGAPTASSLLLPGTPAPDRWGEGLPSPSAL